jgi:tetratricopeptide (TPR) repeat protein
LKTITYKYLLVGSIVVFLVACSTKKNTFISRNSHALSTKYNILYNGGLALDKGIVDLKSQYNDNFWEILPIERMQLAAEEEEAKTKSKNANFERSETKAAKAIQKHSMNIDGSEKNPQMDEAYLMLGKTRYYDQRFIPALEAFNYVLYKYPESDRIYEVKIWREKTNMRLDNDALAVTNLRKLLKDIKVKDQIYSDAHATLAQAFLNIQQKDSALAKLKIARDFTKRNEEKARYEFVLGQIYEQMNYKDSAFIAFQEVIDMKRKSSRNYVIQAHAKQAQQFDYEKGDTIAFLKKYKDLLKDRENRPFLDVLNHQMGLFYDKNKKYDQATGFYNKSLKSPSTDTYLIASNYRNLADINFKKAKYANAGKYYDSTLAVLNNRTREFKLITKKRENLEDVIKYEGIAQRNDSILKLSKMSLAEKNTYYNNFISNLKKEDEKQRIKQEKEQAKAAIDELAQDSKVGSKLAFNKNDAASLKQAPFSNGQSGTSTNNGFYFYNPTTLAYGKVEFVKKWGKREHGPNWRLSSLQKGKIASNDDEVKEETKKDDKLEAKYTPEFYVSQLPVAQKELDSISKERNFAYYQLGVIYKEKFKEYKLAAEKLEKLLENNPEERLVLPARYNLYKIYEIINPSKAAIVKTNIIQQYPSSRYAQILSSNAVNLDSGSPEVVYKSLYKDYESGLFRETLIKNDISIVEFAGDENLPKFELLKANLIGKLYGLIEYKKALNFVALTYPNTDEGKETEKFIGTKIPLLESLYFNGEEPTGWKIIFQPTSLLEADNKNLLEKLNKFAKERNIEKLTVSTDVYTKERNLIVIHGIRNEESAKGIAQVLKDYKEYLISDASIVISSENYKVVQILKNLDEYISGKGPAFEPKQKPTITYKEEQKQEKQPIVIPAVAKGNQIRSNIQDDDTIQLDNPIIKGQSISVPPKGGNGAPPQLKKGE